MRNAMHWRALTTLDLPEVEAIATKVHPSFPEDMAVFAERQRLYPDGARMLELDKELIEGLVASRQQRGEPLPRPRVFASV